MKFLKRLFCKHRYEFLGMAREGRYIVHPDNCWSVFICGKCGKVKLEDKHKIEEGGYSTVSTINQLLHRHYKNKSLKY